MVDFNDTLATFRSITDERFRAMAAGHFDSDRLREFTQRLDQLFSELQDMNEALFHSDV
jgi:hypothetical protein